MCLVKSAGYQSAASKLDFPLNLTDFSRINTKTAYFPEIEDLERYGVEPVEIKTGHAVRVRNVDAELIAWLAEKARGRTLLLGRYGYTKHAVRIDRFTDGGVIVFENFDSALYYLLRWG